MNRLVHIYLLAKVCTKKSIIIIINTKICTFQLIYFYCCIIANIVNFCLYSFLFHVILLLVSNLVSVMCLYVDFTSHSVSHALILTLLIMHFIDMHFDFTNNVIVLIYLHLLPFINAWLAQSFIFNHFVK